MSQPWIEHGASRWPNSLQSCALPTELLRLLVTRMWNTHIYSLIIIYTLHFSYTQTTPLPFTHSHTHIYKQTQTHVSTRFYSFIHTHIYTIYLLLLILPFNVHVIFDSLKIELINCLRVFIVTLLKIPLAGICFSINILEISFSANKH